MSYKLDIAKSSDLDRLVELYKFSYPLLNLSEEERYQQFTQNPRCDLEDVYVAKKGKVIVGSFIAYQFMQYQEDVEIPIIGIARVMVAPDQRRRGVAAFMMRKALEIFEGEDISAAVLYPFEHRFYRHLGWGCASEIREYSIMPSQLYDYLDVLDEKEFEVRILSQSDLPLLSNFYDAAARHYNGMLLREEDYWREELISPPKQVALAYFNGEIIGYIIYSLKESRSNNSHVQLMIVHEWMAPTIDARDALLSYLARQAEQVERMELVLPPDEPLHLWIDDPRHSSRSMISTLFTRTASQALGFMYRIVNLKSAFECGRPFNGVTGELLIDMEDEILGNRRLLANFTGSNIIAEGSSSKAKRQVRGEVDMLSQMFCGFTSAKDAYKQGLLEFEGPDTVEFCQKAFTLSPPRCFDLF